jgi:hypothetical protein
MWASVPAVSLPQDYFFTLNPFIPLHLAVVLPLAVGLRAGLEAVWLLPFGAAGARNYFVSIALFVQPMCLIKP